MNANEGMPPRKVDKLVALIKADKWRQAICLAANWPRLGEERDAIKTAASAYMSPELYRGMGRNPDALVQDGKAAILRRYAKYLEE